LENDIVYCYTIWQENKKSYRKKKFVLNAPPLRSDLSFTRRFYDNGEFFMNNLNWGIILISHI